MRYVEKKSDLTREIALATAVGRKAYRTRTECECDCKDRRRNAVIVAEGNEIVEIVVRCKGCARKEAIHE